MDARGIWGITAALLFAPVTASPAAAQSTSLADVLRGVGSYVESYLTRVQRIVGTETVTVQPLRYDLVSDGFARTLVYELRLDWTAAASGALSPSVVRELMKVNGRPPRPRDEPRCLDPHAVTPAPLEFLLPEKQGRFVFVMGDLATIYGRRAHVIEYRGRTPEPIDVKWNDSCATVDLPGRTRGRVWVDALDSTILRVDEGLIGLVDLSVPREQQRRGAARAMTIERADTSIRYRPVRFDDPEETIFLPETVDSLQIIRDAGTPRVRTVHRFSNYRRFVTGGRIVQ